MFLRAAADCSTTSSWHLTSCGLRVTTPRLSHSPDFDPRPQQTGRLRYVRTAFVILQLRPLLWLQALLLCPMLLRILPLLILLELEPLFVLLPLLRDLL